MRALFGSVFPMFKHRAFLSRIRVIFPLARCWAACFCLSPIGLLAQASVPDAEEADDPVSLPAFEVTTDRDTEYRATNATSSNRFNTSLVDTPQSITVLTEAFLKDFEINDINEALLYVPGVANDAAGAGDDASIQIRGQPVPERLMDGMPDQTPNFRPDPAIFERVEVIKGSASSLYGSSWPGGVINSVTKKPKAKPAYSFKTQFGSYALFREVTDFTGPLNRNKTLLYRIIGVYESSDSFRDKVNSDRKMIMPALTYIFKPGTQIAVNFDYLHTRQTGDGGLPIFTGQTEVVLPRERFLGLPDQDYDIIRRGGRLLFDHRINSDWSLRVGYSYTDIGSSKSQGQVYGQANPTTRRQNRRVNTQTINPNVVHYVQADVLGRFKTGVISHNMLIGADYMHSSIDLMTVAQSITPSFVNLDDPTYDYALTGASSVLNHNTSEADAKGFYIQDQASVLNGRLQAVVGMRYDMLTTKSTSLGAPAEVTFSPPDVLSPRYALLYRPIKAVTLYGTYGESYRNDTSGRPIFGTNDRLKPTTGVLYEVGAKNRFFDGRLSIDVEIFQLDRENIVDNDPNNTGFVIQSGRERSSGYAISFNTDPLPGLTLFGGYGYNDGRVLSSDANPARVGRPLRGNPKHSFTIFAKYRVRHGALKGLGFGLGVRWVDDIPGTTDTTLVFPGYTVVDAQINYNWKRRYSFNLALKNAFDEYYWANAGAFNSNRAGIPRSYRASVTVKL